MQAMNATTQRWCAYCGPLFMITLAVGLWALAGFVPPPAPSASAADTARMYAEHATWIQLGLIVSMLGAALSAPFVVEIFLQMKRIEGEWAPMAYTQLITGLLTPVLVIYPLLAMAAAAFRPERDPAITEVIHDFGWIAFVAVTGPAIIQSVAIAIAVFRDKSAEPVFPRWIGYFNVLVLLSFFPGPFCIIFHTGVLAWNGLFTFYLPLVDYGAWFIIMAVMMVKAINRQELAAGEVAATSEPQPA